MNLKADTRGGNRPGSGRPRMGEDSRHGKGSKPIRVPVTHYPIFRRILDLKLSPDQLRRLEMELYRFMIKEVENEPGQGD